MTDRPTDLHIARRPAEPPAPRSIRPLSPRERSIIADLTAANLASARAARLETRGEFAHASRLRAAARTLRHIARADATGRVSAAVAAR